MGVPVSIHLLSAVIWVGGMFFSLMVLRPCCLELEPRVRIMLMSSAISRFFRWVWAAVILLLASGYWMVLNVYGGFVNLKWHVIAMLILGNIMAVIFLTAFFGPYRNMMAELAAHNGPGAGAQLNYIRKLIMANLAFGIILVVVGSCGRYL